MLRLLLRLESRFLAVDRMRVAVHGAEGGEGGEGKGGGGAACAWQRHRKSVQTSSSRRIQLKEAQSKSARTH